METINYDIACGVDSCKHNHNGCNCMLSKITIGCSCGESCTCCESYSEKH